VWTIGYGTTAGVRSGQHCTEAQAEAFLRADLAKFEATVNKSLRVMVTQEQFDALVAFTYNVGGGAFAGSTLLRQINAGNFHLARENFMKWTKGGGRVLPGLVRRRSAEADLFEKGVLHLG
jgi:lysozyme